MSPSAIYYPLRFYYGDPLPVLGLSGVNNIDLLMTIQGLLAAHSIFAYKLKSLYSTYMRWSCF